MQKKTDSLHIMHVTDTLNTGGRERLLVDLANEQVEKGYSVSICVTRNGLDLKRDINTKIHLNILNRRYRFDFSKLRLFSSMIKHNQIDIIHTHGRSVFSFVAFLKTLGLISVPIVLHDHYGKIEIDRSIPTWFRLWAYRYVSCYIGVHDKLRKWAEKSGIPKSKIHVLSNAIDLRRYQNVSKKNRNELLSILDEYRIGIIVGDRRPEKGLDVALKAFGEIRKNKKVKLLVVGGESDLNYSQFCQKLCATLKMEDDVLFLGQRSDVSSLLQVADFAMMPSRSESGPLTLIEYLVSGVPFVATKVGDISLRVEKTGLCDFIQPDNVEQLRDGIVEILSLSEDQRLKRIAIGKEIAEKYFGIENYSSELENIYNTIE